jgi:hypothetical protein
MTDLGVCVTRPDHGYMASSTTQAVAARVPNDIADQLRQAAVRHNCTMSSVVAACISRAITREHAAPTSHNDGLER